jgi:hypothetical protein
MVMFALAVSPFAALSETVYVLPCTNENPALQVPPDADIPVVDLSKPCPSRTRPDTVDAAPLHCQKTSNFPEPAGLSVRLIEPVNTPATTVVDVEEDGGVVVVVEVVDVVVDVVVDAVVVGGLIVNEPETNAPRDARKLIV